jgi:hypothetical protein
MGEVTRTTSPVPVPGFDDQHITDGDPYEVTPARAMLLAQHAVYVQGGFSTPEIETERARKDMSDGGAPIDWAKFQAELDEALAAKLAVENAQASDREAATTGLDIGLLRRYKMLREHQKIADAESTAFKEEADAMELQLVDMFAEAGIQNINVDGKTIYLNRDVYAWWTAGLEPETKRDLLRAAGAGDLVTETVNGSTLNAWVRELCEDENAPGLPPELDGFLQPGERFSVKIIAGGSKPKRQTRSKG